MRLLHRKNKKSMEKEFKYCPRCGRIGERVRIREEMQLTEHDGYGTMTISVMWCSYCKRGWDVNYIFDPIHD